MAETKELPDLTGKVFKRVCNVSKLEDSDGPLQFWLVKQAKKRSRVFPVDVERFERFLKSVPLKVGESSLTLQKTGYLVKTSSVNAIEESNKSNETSLADLDAMMAKLGLNLDGNALDLVDTTLVSDPSSSSEDNLDEELLEEEEV